MKKFSMIMSFILVFIVAFTVSNASVYAQAVSNSDGISLENASPEEIEDIGMGAMLEAGLINENDFHIEDVTPAGQSVSKENNDNNAVGVIALVLSSISFVAVAVIGFFCYCAGVFKIEKGHVLYNVKCKIESILKK